MKKKKNRADRKSILCCRKYLHEKKRKDERKFKRKTIACRANPLMKDTRVILSNGGVCLCDCVIYIFNQKFYIISPLVLHLIHPKAVY